MKVFHLVRSEDQSGVSGTGHIAWAVEFPHGSVAVSFRDDSPDGPGVKSYYWYDTIADAEQIHGHEGRTLFIEVGGADYMDGVTSAMMDRLENLPACKGWPPQAPEDAGYSRYPRANVHEWWAGYLDSARRLFGKDWRKPKTRKDEEVMR